MTIAEKADGGRRVDLSAALAGHRRWIESDGKEGARAVLRGADLEGGDLQGADLRSADLAGCRLRNTVLMDADLRGADLTSCGFQGADLSRADLRSARMRDANFHDASLVGADLSEGIGLLGGQLSGANLAGATLPPTATGFEGLGNVAEASKTAQNLFTSILIVCSYTWLTVASTTDSQLLNNASPPSSRLPILGTDIPLVRFYTVAPVFLLCLYVYFHLCLQRLWEEFAELPAVFPDGRAVDKKSYPWLMNVIVRGHFARLRHDRSHLARWQGGVSMLLAWGLVPMTLTVLWARYLRCHEWTITLFHMGLVAASVAAAVGFLRLAATTLKGSEKRPFLWRRAWRDARGRAIATASCVSLLLGILSYGAIEGVNPDASERGVQVTTVTPPYNPRSFVPRLLSAIGLNAFAYLDDASLSTRPANWNAKDDSAIAQVKGADLEGRNLRFAAAYKSFFVNGYLRGVDARGSDFREADLRHADFREATLHGANFRSALLTGADLRWANLSGAKFREADLTNARLNEADLTGAQMKEAEATGADFQRADLRGADLTDANLAQANLTGADLTGAMGLTQRQLDLAKLDETTRLPAGFRKPQAVAVNRR